MKFLDYLIILWLCVLVGYVIYLVGQKLDQWYQKELENDEYIKNQSEERWAAYLEYQETDEYKRMSNGENLETLKDGQIAIVKNDNLTEEPQKERITAKDLPF